MGKFGYSRIPEEYRGIVPSTGLLGSGWAAQCRGGEDAGLASDAFAGGMNTVSGDADVVASLSAQLADALANADKWRRLHSELHAFCLEQVVPPDPLTDSGG